MDNNSITALEDYKESIKRIFKSIRKELKEYIGKDVSLHK